MRAGPPASTCAIASHCLSTPESPDPMPATSDGWLITREEIAAWTLRDDEQLLVVNKPALVVCHPSKNGPWSSLVGACREYSGLERVHLVFRLDRETSGVIVLAKERTLASKLQTAVEQRRVAKRYLAILHGEFSGERIVDVPIGPDLGSIVNLKRRAALTPEAKPAQTIFRALAVANGFTVVEAVPLTGRTHQIRAHAEWLGHRVVGDKLYGPSPACYLEFVESGWTESLAQRLLLNRQALHCARVEFQLADGPMPVAAPPTPDLVAFVRERMQVDLLSVM
jgi:23S rRNA pseudouridine1911/1915/1917 synthase